MTSGGIPGASTTGGGPAGGWRGRCGRGGRCVVHEYWRRRGGRNLPPGRRDGRRLWCRRSGGGDRHGRRRSGRRTRQGGGRRHRVRMHHHVVRALIHGRRGTDHYGDGQCHHSRYEDGGYRAAHQQEGLAAFRHVVGVRRDVGGVLGRVGVAKVCGGVTGQGQRVDSGPVGILGVGQTDGGCVVARRIRRRQRGAARQRQPGFIRDDDGHRHQVRQLRLDRGDVHAGADDEQALCR